MPFSDPLADGPVIQRAIERALAARHDAAADARADPRGARAHVDTPIVLFTYANPVLRMERSARSSRAAADAGVDGVLMLDLPGRGGGAAPRAARGRRARSDLPRRARRRPTSGSARSAELGRGFLYVISRLGVTGVRDAARRRRAARSLARVRAASTLPLAVGFGISQPEHVAEVGRWADAAVVGSALVNIIARARQRADVAAAPASM